MLSHFIFHLYTVRGCEHPRHLCCLPFPPLPQNHNPVQFTLVIQSHTSTSKLMENGQNSTTKRELNCDFSPEGLMNTMWTAQLTTAQSASSTPKPETLQAAVRFQACALNTTCSPEVDSLSHGFTIFSLITISLLFLPVRFSPFTHTD